MRVLLTILDNITETSMPFNEFVLYRAHHYQNEKQILVVCGNKDKVPEVEMPENLQIVYAGRNLYNIRKILKNILIKLKNQNVPYVVHIHQVQSGFLSEIAMLGTGFRKKVVFTVHSTFSGYKFHNKFLSFINALLAKFVTCVSNTSYQKYPSIIKKLKGNRIKGIQNGVDIERIDDIISKGAKSTHSGVNFIYVARLIPIKNHKFLVDVLKNCDGSIHFTFVGAEDAEKSIRKMAEDMNVINRIRFTGLIPRNEVFKELQNADYYLSSSVLEGLPVSVLEAMCCKLPCVLSNIPQHSETADQVALILPLDKDIWVKELNHLARITSEERQSWGERSRNYVLDAFSLSSMHRCYDAVYDFLR